MSSARSVVAALALALALGLPGSGQAAAHLAALPQAKADPCPASADWLKPGAPAPDPAVPRDTNCSLHQWGVQEFFYLVQTGGPAGLARFLGMASPHALFLYQGDKPAPYPGSSATRFKLGAGMARLRAVPGKANAAVPPIVFLPRTLKTPNTTFDADTQAGSNAVLIDQKGQTVYYTAQVNSVYYNFVVDKGFYTLKGFLSAPAGTQFPVGTLEVKSSWQIAVKDGTTYIPDAAKRYYTVAGQVCKDNDCKSLVTATMALVGLHVVGSVAGHPEMIWATFEHQDNTPNCQSTPTASPAYAFYKAGSNCGKAPFWEGCNQIPKTRGPSDICRAHPYGEPEGSEGNTANIKSLNGSLQSLLPAGSVWRNYFYASSVWTTGLLNPATGLIQLDDASIRGSKKAANTSLESFTQEKNCLHCHTYQPLQIGTCFPRIDDKNGWKNLYVSHLFGLLCPSAN